MKEERGRKVKIRERKFRCEEEEGEKGEKGWKGRLKFTDKRGWTKTSSREGQRSKRLPLSPPREIWKRKKKRVRRKGGRGVGVSKELVSSQSVSLNLPFASRLKLTANKEDSRHPFEKEREREKRRRRVDSVCQAKTGATEDPCQPLNYSANSIERLGNWSQVGANKLPPLLFNNFANSICLLSITKHASLPPDIPVVILWNCCNFVSTRTPRW